MCKTPNYVEGVGPVSCHQCWQCRQKRVNDLVGRAIAESETSKKTYSVTLTYAGDTVKAKTLVYSDVQKFLKYVRRYIGPVRYICAGEYGEKKGRAHWHIVLFFQDKAPKTVSAEAYRKTKMDVVLERRINWQPWPHGYVFFQQPDYDGMRYVLKYVLKEQKARLKQNQYGLSKKPPLGAQYFDQLAQQYVDNGIAPQDYAYQIYEGKKLHDFYMWGVTRENFLSAFVEKWREQKKRPLPHSEIIQEYLETQKAPDTSLLSLTREEVIAAQANPKIHFDERDYGETYELWDVMGEDWLIKGEGNEAVAYYHTEQGRQVWWLKTEENRKELESYGVHKKFLYGRLQISSDGKWRIESAREFLKKFAPQTEEDKESRRFRNRDLIEKAQREEYWAKRYPEYHMMFPGTRLPLKKELYEVQRQSQQLSRSGHKAKQR